MHMSPNITSILLIYTGGTIGMIENPETGALENFNLEQLKKHVPELQNFTFHIDTYQFDPPMDSSDMDPEAWRKLVHIISDHYDRYTGFVRRVEQTCHPHRLTTPYRSTPHGRKRKPSYQS